MIRIHQTVEFWGIEPNPKVETLRKAVTLDIQEKVDFLLAVGGSSVLDGIKLIACGIAMPEIDPRQIVLNIRTDKQLPFASVMALSATGSEMNDGTVISSLETKEKNSFHGKYPQFSILDPEVTTLSTRQASN